MGGSRVLLALLLCLSAGSFLVRGEDPYFFYTWNVTYGTISPLGVPQQGILINGEFPGPRINCSSNNNIVINVFNNLDEPLLFTWNGIQQRKNSWQDGLPGTNCPIQPGTNFTYRFQVKDQIGTYFYFPSLGMQRAAGGIGGLRVNSRLLIPVPFDDPEDDYTVLIGDWYKKSHTVLKKKLDSGHSIGRPDGVQINGKSEDKDEPLFTMKPGLTYRYRICNVGIKSSLNFRIQVLVTANQDPKDYYMVASTRFLKQVYTAKRIIRYTNGKGPASPELPEPPSGWIWSLNQFRSFRWNLTASAARPNPQDKVFKYNTMVDDPPPESAEKIVITPNVLNITFRTFVEIIFENHEKSIQSWHLNGYSFFAVAMEPGRWNPDKRKNYNLLDAVSRNTIQVYPGSWTAILLTFDNAGLWNLRSETWERNYLDNNST
ncbi:L-ascorbate oxidase-like [Vitis vinifera]|uniref:L-ascorbate oxidase-like n=1 Tax=Vitis vinifera TaxID=29760 RepID=A0A438C6B3_VITVI|nr:L-ascorbate oxidase-like [Vitis vinifera]